MIKIILSVKCLMIQEVAASPIVTCNTTRQSIFGSFRPGNDTVPTVLDYNPTNMSLAVAGFYRDVYMVPEKVPGIKNNNFTFVSYYTYEALTDSLQRKWSMSYDIYGEKH
jgi:hypothetical protein